jgi:hypothetical protein
MSRDTVLWSVLRNYMGKAAAIARSADTSAEEMAKLDALAADCEKIIVPNVAHASESVSAELQLAWAIVDGGKITRNRSSYDVEGLAIFDTQEDALDMAYFQRGHVERVIITLGADQYITGVANG